MEEKKLCKDCKEEGCEAFGLNDTGLCVKCVMKRFGYPEKFEKK